MELITSHIDNIEDLLMKMDEVVDSARSAPFSAKISVEKEALLDVIDEMRAIVYEMRKSLPHEINQARRVLGDKDNHIREARSTAEMMIKAAQTEAAKQLSEHEVTVAAKIAAAEIRESANKEIREFRLSAAQHVDGMFHDLDGLMRAAMEDYTRKSREVEEFFKEIMRELHQNRIEIRTSSEKN